jgi:hypothetical protein
MSWSIEILDNTAVVPEDKRAEVAAIIVEQAGEAFYDYAECTDEEKVNAVFYKGKFNFNSDDMEHMDYLTADHTTLLAVAAAGTEGRICFGSLEGDNAGDFWGVEFASGHYRRLTGEIIWTPGTSYPG